ncbi:hypothetical protein KGF56_001152 [Candida oxycetoniae]|uniref:Mss4-like protein n=1 Tax=Candida oxycetoniae TaxID=497107 RepID=A0AAI9WZ87_9ASCO|nr:uncharacterized protein KGF56_001152 [Candida oxycetoniae]KAI3405933.1 hypothetical protein KGF56_001152 [Candida oxycetoniae]
MPIASLYQLDLDQLLVEKRKVLLKCPFKECNTRIISYSSELHPTYIEQAPNCLQIKTQDEAVPKVASKTTDFFQVDDVWSFDNIGVSKPSSEIQKDPIVAKDNEHIEIERLLICSECDRGPLGFAGVPRDSEKTHENLKYFITRDGFRYEY